MSVLLPLAFWFAAAIPVVVLFYLLKRRRSAVRVSSTVLWRRYLAETQANAPFQRLRRNWLLALQLLVLALAVLGLTRPFLRGVETASSLRVLILDASASMQSTDVSPSRFEAARAEARRRIDSLKPGQSMVLLQAGPRTEVRQSATTDRARLRSALDRCAVTDGAARMAEALKMAESLIRDVPDAEIHLLSDGALGGLEEFENRNLPLIYHKVGERRRNVAFTSLDVRANPENPAQRAVFCAVANLSGGVVETTVELALGDEVLDVRPVRLEPGGTESLVFVVVPGETGVFTVRHGAADDLAVDNEASMVSPAPRGLRVLLVTEGNRFLERALRTVGRVAVLTVPEVPVDISGFDVVVVDGGGLDRWPAANVLAVRAAPEGAMERLGTLRGPAIVDWRSTHPVLRFVNFDNVQVGEAEQVRPPPWGIPLVEAPQGPLILAGEVEGRRIVWVGFDLLSSTWPLRLSFPMFVANAMEWLDPTVMQAGQLNVRVGEPLRLEVPGDWSGPVSVEGPEGGRVSLPAAGGAREIVHAGTDRRGTYRVVWGTNEVVYAVRALDPAESDTQPRDEIRAGRYARTEAAVAAGASREFWRWLVSVALGVLLVEWWFFHRRTA